MKLQLLAVKDRATEMYHPPLCFKHTNEAIRWFRHFIVNAQEPMVKQAPEDFDLWHLGTYDDTNGHIEQLATFEKLADGKSINQTEGA